MFGYILGPQSDRPVFGWQDPNPGIDARPGRNDSGILDQATLYVRILFDRFRHRNVDTGLQLVADLFEAGVWRTVWHIDFDPNKVCFDFRHEFEGYDAHTCDPCRQEKQAEEEHDGCIAVADRQFEEGFVEVVGKPEQAVCNRVLQLQQFARRAVEGLALHM